MNIVVEKHPKCMATLRVEIPAEKVTGERDLIIAGFAGQARIPGFRPGKAPRRVIEKRFQREISEELESRLVREAIDEALRKEKLRVLDFRPPQSPTLHPDGAFSFSSELILAPDFDMPSYKGIEIEVPKVEVSDEMVDRQIEELRGRMAEFEDIEGRPAAAGDFAVINYSSTLDGQPLEEALGKPAGHLAGREDYWVKIDDESFLPGFAAGITGMGVDEEREVPVTLPEDFPMEDLRERELVFQVKLTGLKEQILPELNDEWAAKIVPDSSLEDLLGIVRERLGEDLERRIADHKVERAVEALNRQVSFELPDTLLTAEIQGQADQMVERGVNAGMSSEEIAQQQEEIFNAAGHRARTNLRTNFILQEIAGAEGLEVEDRDMLQHLGMMAQQQGKPVKKFIKEMQRDGRISGIRNSLLVGKAIDFILEHAIFTEVDPPEEPEVANTPAPTEVEEAAEESTATNDE